MDRRFFVAGAAAASACASAPPRFSSNRISVVARGEGPDVILIPGMTSHRSVWATTVAALDRRYRFHQVQVFGFAGFPAGENATGEVSAPVAEEIARYITEQRLGKVSVIGHSMGGTIGMMLAARYPDMVRRLMVVDMFPFMGVMFGPPGVTAEQVRPTADQMRTQMLANTSAQNAPMVEQMIATMVKTESARPGLIEQSRTSDRTVVANSFHELIVTDLRPELPRITMPLTVLYVVPPNAPVSPEQYSEFFRLSYQSAPQTRLIKIDDSWHFIMIDQPARFQNEIREFMRT